MGKPPMPDTPPTPTVIESDRILARKWYRCGCGATYETIMESEPAARQRHHHHVADEVESVASQIAAAREAWGAERPRLPAGVEVTADDIQDAIEIGAGVMSVERRADIIAVLRTRTEAVAGLVEAAEALPTPHWLSIGAINNTAELRLSREGYEALRAALERAKEAQG